MIQPTYIYRARCVRIVDADTMWMDVDCGMMLHAVVPIRLLHIDTYERNTDLGKQAARFVADLIREQELVIQTKKDEQTFGRWLADVWVNGQLLSEILKEAGFAKPDSPWNA